MLTKGTRVIHSQLRNPGDILTEFHQASQPPQYGPVNQRASRVIQRAIIVLVIVDQSWTLTNRHSPSAHQPWTLNAGGCLWRDQSDPHSNAAWATVSASKKQGTALDRCKNQHELDNHNYNQFSIMISSFYNQFHIQYYDNIWYWHITGVAFKYHMFTLYTISWLS